MNKYIDFDMLEILSIKEITKIKNDFIIVYMDFASLSYIKINLSDLLESEIHQKSKIFDSIRYYFDSYQKFNKQNLEREKHEHQAEIEEKYMEYFI